MRHGVVILALIVALGVSACGRKGPLAPPPGQTSQIISSPDTRAV